MININNKQWDDLTFEDIVHLLNSDTNESFFFEFKSDKESIKGFIKEVSAFSNTYGGYIFLGINDDKTISGCSQWTEEKIHNVMFNNITPVPIFDVRVFKTDDNPVIVVKIEAGTQPPYITNKGVIYERISSGSCPVSDSNKLVQLFHRHTDEIKRIEEKIEFKPIHETASPNNICGFVDLGFSLIRNNETLLSERFRQFDVTAIVEYLNQKRVGHSITKSGTSLIISCGTLLSKENNHEKLPKASLQNFIEIMRDGSARCRVILTIDDNNQADISFISLFGIFRQVYSLLWGPNYHKHFICAHKYEKLTVLNQFYPCYNLFSERPEYEYFQNYVRMQHQKYGRSIIIDGNRIPKSGYMLIDRATLEHSKDEFNDATLCYALFWTEFFNLGFVESLDFEI